MSTIRKIGYALTAGASAMVPFIVSAADTTGDVTDVTTLAAKIKDIINLIIPVFIAVAVVYFIFNVLMYVIKSSSEDDRKTYRGGIIHGLVGLFIIVAFWGLVNIVINTLDLETKTPDVSGGSSLFPPVTE